MDIWIVWDNDEYASSEAVEILAIFDTEEKAQTRAAKLDRDLHQQMRDCGLARNWPNGFPTHRVSKHTVM